MNKKVWVFWFVVIGGLIGTVFVSLYAGSEVHKEQNITLKLDVAPGVFYRSGNQYAINSNPYSAVSFSYFIDANELESYKYLKFGGSSAESPYQVTFKIFKGKSELYSDYFLHSGNYMIELPDSIFNEKLSSSELELRMSVDIKRDMGLSHATNEVMAFDGLFLTSASLVSRWEYIKTWVGNRADYQLSSLNFWQKQTLLPQLALGLVIWLTVVLSMSWLKGVPYRQVFWLLFLVMLVPSVHFIFKQVGVKYQVELLYSSQEGRNDINDLDKQIHLFTDEFNDWLKNNNVKDAVVFIKSSDAFVSSRMRYHLHETPTYNYVYWSDVSAFKKNNGLNETFLLTTRKILPDCKESARLFVPEHAEKIMANEQFCVVRL